MPVNWGNALERDMIEIKDEILYLVICRVSFFLFERFHPVLEINNIDPNFVAALRVNVVDALAVPPPNCALPPSARKEARAFG